MISVVITHSSIENQFIDRQLKECAKFSDDIVVVSLKNFINGEEDKNLRVIYKDNVKHKIVTCLSDSIKDKHNTTRWQGFISTDNKYDYVLFLDGDEIPNGDLFKEHLDNYPFDVSDALSYKCYWYFRSELYRAKTTEQCALLVKKSVIDRDFIFHEAERWNFLNRINPLNYELDVASFDGEPMLHHYSWVRTKEQMLQKVSGWGHSNERDWKALVEEEFSREFSGRDFVHNYEYEILEKNIW